MSAELTVCLASLVADRLSCHQANELELRQTWHRKVLPTTDYGNFEWHRHVASGARRGWLGANQRSGITGYFEF